MFLSFLRVGCFPMASCALVFLQLRFMGRLFERGQGLPQGDAAGLELRLEQATPPLSGIMTGFCSMDVRFAGNSRPATEHHATCHRFSHFFRNILTEKCTSS